MDIFFFWAKPLIGHPWAIAFVTMILCVQSWEPNFTKLQRGTLLALQIPMLIFFLTELTTPSSTNIRVDLVMILPCCLIAEIAWISLYRKYKNEASE